MTDAPSRTPPDRSRTTATDWRTTRGEKWRAQLAGMEATLAPIDAPLIAALRLDAPYRIADVACGGGGTSLEILRRAPPGSVVSGFDIAPPLVEAARGRIPAGVTALRFEDADIATTVPAVPYERLVSRFGTMFFDDPPAAFANLYRWLSPGGRFAFAVWASPSDNPWMMHVRDVVAELVHVPRPERDTPGPFRYAEVGLLTELLAAAGFAEREVQTLRTALPIGGGLPPHEAAAFALTSFASFGELLAEAGEAALEEGRRALTARLAAHQRDGAVWVDACVHIVTGTRVG